MKHLFYDLYLREIAEVISTGGPPDPAVIAAIRARHDIAAADSAAASAGPE